MASFTVNTHHAYLNNDIVINSEGQITIVDNITGEKYDFQNELTIHLSAGRHILKSDDHEEEIYIEDAIKFGGSRIKNAFVFDNNPWAFITTKDRMYAVNILSGTEKVEYSLTPDTITSLGMYYGKPCEYFLFNNKQDYSIYNIETGKIIVTFSNHIFSNNHLIIYDQDETVKVYDYRLNKFIVEFEGQYSFGNKFYFVKENQLYGLNLSSSYINIINDVGKLTNDYLLYKNYLLKLKSDYQNEKNYEFFSLGNGENNIKLTCIKLPYYVEKWENFTLSDLSDAKQELNDFNKEWELRRKFPHICHHVLGIRISEVNFYLENKEHKIKLTGFVQTYPSICFTIPFTLSGVEGSTISYHNCVVENNQVTFSSSNQEIKEDKFNLPKEEKLLGKSISGNLIISLYDNCIIYRNIKENFKKQILIFFDNSQYVNAFFTSDGKNVIFENINKEFNIIGFEDLSLNTFNIEGITVSRKAGFNGYKPEIVISDSRKLVWRDPISLAKVKSEDLSDHIFKSADGKFTALNDKKVIYKNRITNSDITLDEYRGFCKRYDFEWNDTDEEKEKKIARRKDFFNEFGQDLIKTFEREHNEIIDSTIENYLNKRDKFTPLFIDPLGYVIYHSDEDKNEKKILIGRSVYFLNYVSFSYDSRYLSFGAKMKRDDFRYSEDGVFVLYDLKEEKEIIRLDNGENLYAVWMTMFNKDSDVAFYDSKADSYIATFESNYKEINKIKGKSLLCYSPSGRYIAFSDQNYIDFTHHPYANWGHQPSSNIFIHKTKDVQVCLEQYNDFGEGISGVQSHYGNVASVAFSCDEKRLLAVGDDGVVVIRNLHLDMHEKERNTNATDEN